MSCRCLLYYCIGMVHTYYIINTNQTPCFPSFFLSQASSSKGRLIKAEPKLSHSPSLHLSPTLFILAHNRTWPNMKREGRQHGMVRTYRILPSPLNPRPSTRFVNQFNSPTTAGLFTKVSSKPTNHSKFTGKCGQPRCTGCHLHPACKSKDKTKGTHKMKSSDVVAEGRQRLNFSGYSATGILDQLSGHCVDDDHDDDDSVVNEHDGSCGDGNVVEDVSFDPTKSKIEIINEDGDHGNDDDDDDDAMSFCNVGYVLDQVEGDEDWCLVGEM